MKTIIYITLFVAIFSQEVSIQEKIYLNAKANIDETAWAKDVDRQAKRNKEVFVTEGEWKCNLFVYEIILVSGYDIGTPNRARWISHPILNIQGKNKRPPCCSDWYNLQVEGFTFIGEGEEGKNKCKKGDIVTNGVHIGIIAGDGETISAAKEKVVKNDWGYRGDEGVLRYFRYDDNQ